MSKPMGNVGPSYGRPNLILNGRYILLSAFSILDSLSDTIRIMYHFNHNSLIFSEFFRFLECYCCDLLRFERPNCSIRHEHESRLTTSEIARNVFGSQANRERISGRALRNSVGERLSKEERRTRSSSNDGITGWVQGIPNAFSHGNVGQILAELASAPTISL